jgi:hypothetical protein
MTTLVLIALAAAAAAGVVGYLLGGAPRRSRNGC